VPNKYQIEYGDRPRGNTGGSTARLIALLTIIAGVTAAPVQAAESCPNAQGRTESNPNLTTGRPYSTQLPDCRAYELVSPPDTGGIPAVSLDEGATSRPRTAGAEWDQVTPGGALYWISRAQPAGTGAVPNGTSIDLFVSRRTAAGWTTRDLTPFPTIGENELIAGAPDSSTALIITQTSLVPEDQDNPLNTQGALESVFDIYRVSEGETPLLVSHGTLPRTVPPQPAGEGIELKRAGEITENAALTAVAFVSTARLTAAASLGFKDCYAWSDVGVRLAFLTNPEFQSAVNRNCELLGMTPDGRPILRDLSADNYSGLIFVGNGSEEFPEGKVSAVQLSAPAFTTTMFDAVSPDGSLGYVTTVYPLGNEERASEPNVYAVTVPAFPNHTLVTPGTGSGNSVVCLSCRLAGGGPATFVTQSADGSHVFFNVAEAAGESAGHPYKGLWSWDRNTKTAARLTDATDVEHLISSQNGAYAVGLTRQLAKNPEGTADVYEFSASLTGPQLITSGVSADTYRLSGNEDDVFRPPTATGVSNDGRRVVYDDQPPAVEGRLPPETAQEWRTSGATIHETVQLSPLGARSSYYVLGTGGPELEDVFFAAQEPLVPADRNGGTQDVYDARAQGGFAPCTAGNPSPPPGSTSCTATTSTPNPQAPSPSPYMASLGLAALSLPPLPADTSHPASKPAPLSCHARATKIKNATKRARELKRCRRPKPRNARKSVRVRSRITIRSRGGK
jgi:hypothetical protein